MAFSSRIKRVNWPAFSRTLVTFVGPGGPGAGAAAGWATTVFVQCRRKRRTSENAKKCCFLVIFVVNMQWKGKQRKKGPL